MKTRTKMKVSELEERSSVPRTTIHFYVREGILHRPDKTGRTMAYYDKSHLERLKLIKKLQNEYMNSRNKSYMPLPELKKKLAETDRQGGMRSEETDSTAQQTRREQRRKDIIGAALRLYTEKGYYQTNVRDIARQAGISPSAFYIYFPDKRELFSEVIDLVVADMTEKVQHALSLEHEELKRPVLLLQAWRDNYHIIGEILFQLRAGMAQNDQWAMQKLNKLYWDLAEGVAREVERGINNGLIRETKPDLMAFFIVGMAEIVVHLATVFKEYSFEQLAVFAADLYINGMAPQKPNAMLQEAISKNLANELKRKN